MLLSGAGGCSVWLSPVGYEFPARVSTGAGDWDANWLVIDGAVRTPAGRWSFTEPCLTTWDAQALASWLRGVAAGQVPPVVCGDVLDETGLLTFTEPCLGFSVLRLAADEAVVRVHLSYEAAPPPLPDFTDTDAFSVPVRLSLAALVGAADDWDRELARLPPR